MFTYIKFLVLIVTPVLILCANAWGLCTNQTAEAEKDPQISAFVERLGGIGALVGFWENKLVSKSFEIKLSRDRKVLLGQTGRSNEAPLLICTTPEPEKLKITINHRRNKKGATQTTVYVVAKKSGKLSVSQSPNALQVQFGRGIRTAASQKQIELSDLGSVTTPSAPQTVR
ncbi:MAG: hypothetical protein V4692_16485 [Bdellovibrionota bacterium]